MPRSFRQLTDREILALAITLETEDARVYGDIADALQKDFPASARVFEEMIAEETGHRQRLTELYRARFGEHITMIRRTDVKGFVHRRPVWLAKNMSLEKLRAEAASMELETRRFYERAAAKTTDLSTRELLTSLAEAERRHAATAEQLSEENLPQEVRADEEKTRKRLFVLQVVQPGLAGLMDGSVSTLAPLFAAAFAAYHQAQVHPEIPYNHFYPFQIGAATSVGAGISMGFAEALSDDGSLTGRGRPLVRGIVCGLMTAAGGIGHTLPYLIPHFQTATIVAFIVVAVELASISWIRHRFMEAPWLAAAIQVVIGGLIVLVAGILIGSG